MSARVIAALIVLAGSHGSLDPTAETILNIRLAAATLQTFLEQGGSLATREPRLVTLESFASNLGIDLKRTLVTRDGWGRPLRLFQSEGDYLVIISFGADGAADIRYDEVATTGGRAENEHPVDPDSPDRDIVFMGKDFEQRPKTAGRSVERALEEIRAIGTAMESYAVDNDAYPGPTSGLQTIGAVVKDLEPIYVKQLPRLDPWGQHYWVWSSGKAYCIVSGGADGRIDSAYGSFAEMTAGPAASTGPAENGADIVFADGQFVRLPAVDPE